MTATRAVRRTLARRARDRRARAIKPDPFRGRGYRAWHRGVYPEAFTKPYAPHHLKAWEWVNGIGLDRPDPFLALWPRGHTKSTFAEVAVAMLGTTGRRTYCLYLSATQLQADDHVANVGAVFESDGCRQHYPQHARRLVNQYGSSKGWRAGRIRTAGGFTIDGLGLDSAKRGAKLGNARPDIIVFDDIDESGDSPAAVAKKLHYITHDLLPALADNAVVIMAQNFVHSNAIAVQIAENKTDVLAEAVPSGPFPAIENMTVENRDGLWHVTGGDPTWEGYGLAEAQRAIRLYGLTAFTIEVQQDVEERPGALWTKEMIDPWRWPLDKFQELEIDEIAVGVDPNKTGRGDDAGIIVAGRAWLPDGEDGEILHAFVLEDKTQLTNPETWRDECLRAAIKWGATRIVVESAGLGEHAKLTLQGSPLYKQWQGRIVETEADMGRSKADRARGITRYYDDHRVHHVGQFRILEGQQTGWEPELGKRTYSPGAIDALVHVLVHLLIDRSKAPRASRLGNPTSRRRGDR